MTQTKKAILALLTILPLACAAAAPEGSAPPYPVPLSDYPAVSESLWQTLRERAAQAPFNIVAAAIFGLALLNTFTYRFFSRAGDILHKRAAELEESDAPNKIIKGRTCYFFAKFFHLGGEIEIIFGLWLLPLFIGFWLAYGWEGLTSYLDDLVFAQRKYVEPAFVIVVMCIAATRPVIQFASDCVRAVASVFGGGAAAWWISILCIGPLLGSFITEPAAITICAILLVKNFYAYNPSPRFKYATLGLLLVAVSAGGTLSHFSAPPVLMVAAAWEWDFLFMLSNFGWKAALGIVASVLFYYFIFRGQFRKINAAKSAHEQKSEERVPLWIVLAHLYFLFFVVVSLHHPALFFFTFMFFIAFVESTHAYQYKMRLGVPIKVGLFLAALVTHGSLQAWWIEPLLLKFSEGELFACSIVLTAFNDNAAITYLASLVPNFSDSMKYFVMSGAIAGGGLTVIANAPNPAGIAVLGPYFKGGVSPVLLFLSAFIPTAILSAAFLLL